MLWQRSLVMVDEETKSLWSHLLGTAMKGDLKGTELESIPSVITDWKTWRTDHPRTTVLMMGRTSRNYRREFYEKAGLSRFVFGLARHDKARAWPLDGLQRQPVVNDRFDDRNVVVVFQADSISSYVYDRRVDDQVLSFEMKGDSLIDAQTGSQWDPATGKARSGTLKGSQLKPLAGILSYRRAWDAFHPDGTYWSPQPKSP